MTASPSPEKIRFWNRLAGFFRFRFPPLALYILIFFLSSRPASDFPSGIPDWIPHFGEFFLLSFLVMRMWERPLSRKTVLISFPLLVMLALLDEIHQLYVPTRTFSGLDLVYDLAGIVGGMLVFSRLKNVPDPAQKRDASQIG